MGEVISIRDAHRARRRRQDSELNARCRELISAGMDFWWLAYTRAPAAERSVCLERLHQLGDLLDYAKRLP
jgi:hypothetical protein